MKQYQVKQSKTAIVKDVDTAKGIVTGYFASFDTLDSDGDVFQKGAFSKSLNEGSKRIMHLLQHDVSKPLARPELKQDDYGLWFKSEITTTSYGKDAIKLYADGVFNEHSVGFQTVKEQTEQRDGNSYNLITEVKLWEGSTVTWGANENTPVSSFKSLTKTEQLDKLDKVVKALGRGELHDNTYELLSIWVEQLKSLIEPSDDTHQADEIKTAFLSGFNFNK